MINIMYPILARYGSLFVYSYTVVMAAGIISGIGLIGWSARHIQLPDWFDALLVIMLAALIGGRAGFVFSRWDYFREQPHEAWQIWQGGLSYHAALLAGILALAGWAIVKKHSFYRYAATFAPALVLVSVFGWLACWFEGCAYGQVTVLSIMSADLADEYGVFAVRYQTQLAGFLLMLGTFLFILWYQKRRPDAYVFWMVIALVSLVHLLLSLVRGDPTIAMGSLRMDTFLNALLAAVSLLLLQYMRLKDKGNRRVLDPR
jgi:phosphatidylglycerol---prolipoprotein diacylglyceryl transferase